MHEGLERRFAAMGARLSVAERPWNGSPRIDVLEDRRGEYFDITFAGEPGEVDLEVIDVRPRDRHLLLLARSAGEKSKFLLGHDERHWFVAAVPEAARGVTGVTMAKQRLTPQQRSSGSGCDWPVIPRCTPRVPSVMLTTQRSCSRPGTCVHMNTEHDARAMQHVVFID